MKGWKERERQVYMQTGHRRLDVTIVRGQGTRVWDDDDKEYLDFIGGWAALSLGHSHPAVVSALKKQADTLLHVTNDAYTIPQIELGEDYWHLRVVGKVHHGDKVVLITSSGNRVLIETHAGQRGWLNSAFIAELR